MRIRFPQSREGKKIVIIVGAGFAGLNAAKALSNEEEVHVILADQKNHHLFQPLLYQVATAGLNPSDIAVPIRTQFNTAANVEVYLSKIESVHLQEKYIVTPEAEFEYDYLLLACGAQHSYFSHPDWQDFAPGLKTLEQATEIRRRILLAFERAENAPDPGEQKALLTFVIVGGGPTGVELAGAIAEISRTVLVKDFKRINPASASVILLESGDRVLGGFHESLSKRAERDLTQLGVTVRTSTQARNVTASGVETGEDFISSQSIFWAAGVQAKDVPTTPAVERDRAGRIIVSADFSIPGFPDAYVAGDMASREMKPGEPLPGLAPVAIQSGRYVARSILGRIRGRQARKFSYSDKGSMATIGKNRAIAQFGIFRFHGRVAWLLWLFIHIFYLIGFKNRVAVMLQWSWSYLLSKRGARLITDKQWQI